MLIVLRTNTLRWRKSVKSIGKKTVHLKGQSIFQTGDRSWITIFSNFYNVFLGMHNTYKTKLPVEELQ